MLKKNLLLILYLIPFIVKGQYNELLSYFEKVDTLKIELNYSKKITDSNLIQKYLCAEKNECFFNSINNYDFYYYTISKKEYPNYWILTYVRTDTYENDMFMITLNKKNGNIVSRLHIFNTIGDNTSLASKVFKDVIIIYRKTYRECDSNNEEKLLLVSQRKI